jgi:hypothetical protein
LPLWAIYTARHGFQLFISAFIHELISSFSGRQSRDGGNDRLLCLLASFVFPFSSLIAFFLIRSAISTENAIKRTTTFGLPMMVGLS